MQRHTKTKTKKIGAILSGQVLSSNMEQSELLQSFPADMSSTSVSKQWKSLKQTLLHCAKQKPAGQHEWYLPILLESGGKELWKNLTREEAESFRAVLDKMEDFLIPILLLVYDRFRFFSSHFNSSTETLSEFLHRLVFLHKSCEFDDPHVERLKEVAAKKLHRVDAAMIQSALPGSDPIIADLMEQLAAQPTGCKHFQKDGKDNVKTSILDTHGQVVGLEIECDGNVQAKQSSQQGVTLCSPLSCQISDSKGVIDQSSEKLPSIALREKSTADSKVDQNVSADEVKGKGQRHGGIDTCVNIPNPQIVVDKAKGVSENIVNCSSALEKMEASAASPIARGINSRPKRELRIPNRLQSDKDTVKLLKFNERSRAISKQVITSTMQCEKETDRSVTESIPVPDTEHLESNHPQTSGTTPDGKLTKRPLQSSSHPNPTKSGESRRNSSLHLHYKCVRCALDFKTLSSFTRHKYSHKGGDKSFKCLRCKSRFHSRKDWITHSKTEHGNNGAFVCSVCGKAFTTALNLRVHKEVHTKNQMFKCKFCSKSYKGRASLERHHRTHKGTRSHSCQVCEKKFFDASGLKKHIKTHGDEKPFICNLCNIRTRTLTALKAHIRKHLDISCTEDNLVRYCCPECEKTFKNKASLKCHIFHHSGEKPYKCEVCGATFVWLAAFRRHAQTHTNIKPYKCQVCGKSYADKAYLKRHVLIHTGERPYICHICSHTFVTAFDLKQHAKIHSNEKKFICEVCGASFVRKCYLYKHKRIHNGVKTHACDQCDRKFYEPHRLRDHKKRHEKAANRLKKRFICEVCGRVFAKKVYLTKHMMTHTGNKPYLCPKCPAKFVDSFKLKLHIRTHDKGTARKVRVHRQTTTTTSTLNATERINSDLAASNSVQTVVAADSSQSEHLEIHIEGVKEDLEKEILQLVSGERGDTDHTGSHQGEVQYVVQSSDQGSEPLQQIVLRQDQMDNVGEYKIIIVEIP